MRIDAEKHKDAFLRMAKRVRDGWCRHAGAVDKNGCPVRANSASAVEWCMIGAMSRETSSSLEYGDVHFLVSEKLRAMGSRCHIAEWNDAVGRTRDEVVDLFLELAYGRDEVEEKFRAPVGEEVVAQH